MTKTLALATISLAALSGCASTRNYPTVLPDGRTTQRIECEKVEKCEIRAREVCGRYVVLEPLHRVPDDPGRRTMTVECRSSEIKVD